MIRFIIATTQRSGSSLMRMSLQDYPGIQCHGDLFINVPKPEWPMEYQNYIRRSLFRKLEHRFYRRALIKRYLNWVLSHDRQSLAVGFKLMYNQARRYPDAVEWIRAHDFRVVHLVRKNSLRTLISEKIANSTRVYTTTKDAEQQTLELDPPAVLNELRRRQALVEQHPALWTGCPLLEISYESFVANRDLESRRLLEFLEVPYRGPLESSLRKISRRTLRETVANYDEVSAALAGTQFETLLTEL